MANKYSAEWIREQVEERKARSLRHHPCAICENWTAYYFYRDGAVEYDSSCGCAESAAKQQTYQDVANWLAMQRSDEIRDGIMSRLN